MAGTITLFVVSLAVLLGGASVADASGQEDQLSKFLASRAMARTSNGRTAAADGPDYETDRWSDPSTFADLPERCKSLPTSGSKEADRIEKLPGQPRGVNFRQYSGYVKVNDNSGRELFYYFAESPYDAASKPLILWLNGGPGCSSLGYGALEELGPFRVNPDGKTLRRNKHSWTNLANVIFLESPAGVGFSFSRNETEYSTAGDERTATDAYFFIANWMERFPEYKGRDFYVAGESYGGHYVPQLATVIRFMSNVFRQYFPDEQSPINLKGIFVGNPFLDEYLNNKGQLEFMWSHGMISDEVWEKILATCSFDASDDFECLFPWLWFNKGNINLYNIYAPVCLNSSTSEGMPYVYPSSHDFPGYDPCSDVHVTRYLNRREVQTALHARTNTDWSICSNEIFKTWRDASGRMAPMIRRLIDYGLKVWIYSGDVDTMCSLTATRYSVKDLNLTVTKKWRPWYTPDKEVGGYVQQYQKGFTLASVRGAGHQVPSFQPKRSLVLLYSFLKGMLPPAVIPN